MAALHGPLPCLRAGMKSSRLTGQSADAGGQPLLSSVGSVAAFKLTAAHHSQTLWSAQPVASLPNRWGEQGGHTATHPSPARQLLTATPPLSGAASSCPRSCEYSSTPHHSEQPLRTTYGASVSQGSLRHARSVSLDQGLDLRRREHLTSRMRLKVKPDVVRSEGKQSVPPARHVQVMSSLRVDEERMSDDTASRTVLCGALSV